MPGRKRKNPERIRILSDIIQTEARRVFHCVAVTAVVQHFDIISAVPEGSALLRRNPPAFCKSFKAGSLMTSRYDQVNISLFCHFLSLFCHLRRYSKGVYPVSSRKILPK